MCQLHVVLIDHGIAQRSVYFDVSKQALHLLYGHAFVDGHRCQCAAKLVWVYLG